MGDVVQQRLAVLQAWVTGGLVFLVVFCVTMTALMFWQAFTLNSRADQSHVALCSFKADLERRHREGRDYVSDIRKGRREPIPGITLADVERSVANQGATLASLASLDCS